MSMDIAKTLQKKNKEIFEKWMSNQLADDSLREDIISNGELREQSKELLDDFLKALSEKNLDNANAEDYDKAKETLSGISISRARQGFSPRETAVYIFSLKE